MNDSVVATDDKFICLECKNEVELSPEANKGDVVECEFCGIEYEYAEDNDEGKVLKVIEEEK